MIFNYGTIQEETNQVLYNINMKMNLEEFKIFSSIMNNLTLEDLYKVTLIKQQVKILNQLLKDWWILKE